MEAALLGDSDDEGPTNAPHNNNTLPMDIQQPQQPQMESTPMASTTTGGVKEPSPGRGVADPQTRGVGLGASVIATSALSPAQMTPQQQQKNIQYQKFCNIMLNYLKANHVEMYNRIRQKIQEFGQLSASKDPVKIVQLLKSHLPAKIFEAGHATFQRIIRETEWKSKGFTRNPTEEVDVQVNVSHSEYARVFKSKEVPLGGLNLGEEQLKLLTSVGLEDAGTLGSSGLLQQQSQPQVIKEQYLDWSKKNLLSARSSFSRLRVPRANTSNNEVVDFVGTGRGARVSAKVASNPTPATEWKSPAQVENSDAACAMLSMATQEFIKMILTASIATAQKEVGADGIRIHAMQKIAKSQPPLGMILGKDVDKQIARASYKVCKVYKKQETTLAKKYEQTKSDTERFDMSSMESSYTRNITDMGVLSKRKYIAGESEKVVSDSKKILKYAETGKVAPLGIIGSGKIRITRMNIVSGVETFQKGPPKSAAAFNNIKDSLLAGFK